MDEGGNTKDDLGLPKGTDDAEKLADQIKKDFDDGKELVVTVLKVSGLGILWQAFVYAEPAYALYIVCSSTPGVHA